jgi:hypothetical protein
MNKIFWLDIGVGSFELVSISKDDGDKLVLDAIGETKTPRVDWMKAEKNDKAMAEMASAMKLLLNDLKIKSKKEVNGES